MRFMDPQLRCWHFYRGCWHLQTESKSNSQPSFPTVRALVMGRRLSTRVLANGRILRNNGPLLRLRTQWHNRLKALAVYCKDYVGDMLAWLGLKGRIRDELMLRWLFMTSYYRTANCNDFRFVYVLLSMGQAACSKDYDDEWYKTSTTFAFTRPTQPFILSGSINE